MSCLRERSRKSGSFSTKATFPDGLNTARLPKSSSVADRKEARLVDIAC
jgi:hypothetical protein